MEPEKKYELIEKHLAGTLSETEENAFRRMLESEPGLANEVKLHQRLDQVLAGDRIHAFREKLKQTDRAWKKPEEAKKMYIRRKPKRSQLAIAATIVLLLAASLYLLLKPGSDGTDSLYAANFAPYEMVLNQRGAADESPRKQLEAQAVSAYENQQFDQAAQAFASLQEIAPNEDPFQFYYCLSVLASGQPDKAIPGLELLSEDSNSLFQEQSRWYLALAYLKNGQLEQAKSSLAQIETGAYRSAEAARLLRKLKRISE
ncbi:MAG: tetratricopeptide repeat protein [Bacteroidetes bacterium]|nr:tetratricopeptide repeat protein [Bacteroidota bacterium]